MGGGSLDLDRVEVPEMMAEGGNHAKDVEV